MPSLDLVSFQEIREINRALDIHEMLPNEVDRMGSLPHLHNYQLNHFERAEHGSAWCSAWFSVKIRLLHGTTSQQMESHIHRNLHRHRNAIFLAGIELPGPHRLDGLLVQAKS